MKFYKYLIVFVIPITLFSYTLSGKALADKLGLNASSKAMIQWERVFKNERKIKRYKIDILSANEQRALKDYLINHAIDSDYPTVAGE